MQKNDIREFLELIYDLDSDRDCFLTKQEFLLLVDKFNLSPSSDYTELVYKAMSNKSHKKISFSNTRTIFEASNNGYFHSTVCQMLFKGVSEDEKMYLTLRQFKRMALAIDPERVKQLLRQFIGKIEMKN
jgi:hypothetical protein